MALASSASRAISFAADAMDASDQVLTPAPLLRFVGAAAGAAGVSHGEIRLFLGLLAAYPLALTWRALPAGPGPLTGASGARIRHIFSVLVGGWLLMFVNGPQALVNLATIVLCYACMAAGGRRSAVAVSVLAMGMLSAGHLYRQITAYLEWTLDWTLVGMVTTQKVMGLAFNVRDGGEDEAKLSKKQKALSVKELPSFLEYMSFMLFPASVTIGPAFEYSDYAKFASGEAKSPPPYLPGLARLVQGVAFFLAHTLIASRFPATEMLASKEFFATGNRATQYAQVWVALLGHRFKYYFGWKIAEGAACMAGLGYNGVDKATGKFRWDRLENIGVWQYEASQSLRQSSHNWNKTTNLWLRRYVYERAPRSVNLYFTYLVSAFWHGFYPGYYIFFLSIAVCTFVHRSVRRSMRPRFMKEDGVTPGPYKPAYDVASAIATTVTVNYFIMSFIVLALDQSIHAFRSFGFFGHYVLAAALSIFALGIVRPPPKKKTEAKVQ